MQEISLTGATLLDDASHNHHNHSHSHSHNHHQQQQHDPLASTVTEEKDTSHLHPSLEMTARIVSAPKQQQGHQSCCGPQPTLVQPMLELQIPISELIQQPTSEILKAIWQIVRMGGTFALLQDIVTAWKEAKGADAVYAALRTSVDPASGHHTLLHWATKRDLQFVEFFLCQVQCPATRPSTDATQMTAVHWVCTLPSRTALPMLRLIVTTQQRPQQQSQQSQSHASSSSAVLEVTDSTGCTPLLLAAQHGHVETAAYLIQVGANVRAVDQHGDSAVHWAAYKGSIHILGLLSYYHELTAHFWTAPDAYGQMPLHLAALRGHTTACRYILQHLKDARQVRLVLYHKDSNGRTPLELAQHKEKWTVAATLQAAVDQLEKKGWKKVDVRKTASSFFSKHAWKVWLGLPSVEMDDMDESPQFPYYYVWTHMGLNLFFYFTVFYPVFNVGAGVMWDRMGLHIWNWVFMTLTIVLFRKTTKTNPGRLDDQHPRIGHWRALYRRTLENYAHADFTGPQLCHTCHIARPARSKHDRFTGSCIEVFDHHCPFVGTTVGLYNYGYFFLFCLCMTLYFVGFWITLVIYAYRVRPWITLLFGAILGAHGTFPLGMCVYHSQLLWLNLTTNEHIHTQKYEYFWDIGKDPTGTPTKKFRNPWNRGGWHNMWSKLMEPSEALYALPEEQQQQPLLKHDQLQHAEV